MKNTNLLELTHDDLIRINGGVDEVAFNTGYAAGQIVGRMVRNFLTLGGIWKYLI